MWYQKFKVPDIHFPKYTNRRAYYGLIGLKINNKYVLFTDNLINNISL